MKPNKCTGCGLVNAASDTNCRRCNRHLSLTDGYIDPKSPRPGGGTGSISVVILAVVAIAVTLFGFLFYRSFTAAGEPPKAEIPSILPPPTPTEQEKRQVQAMKDLDNKLKNMKVPETGYLDSRKLNQDTTDAIQPALDEMQRKNNARARRMAKEVERDVAETGIVGH